MSDLAEPVIHTVTFERNTRVADFWRASCSCGWLWLGKREDVQSRAAVHDIEWQPADPAKAETT